MIFDTFKFSQLVEYERNLLLEDERCYSNSVFCFYPSAQVEYEVFIAVDGEEDRSEEQVASKQAIEDFVQYYKFVLGDVDLSLLFAKVPVESFLNNSYRGKRKLNKHYPLIIDTNTVSEILVSGGPYRQNTFIIGSHMGVSCYLKTRDDIEFNAKGLHINKPAYEKLTLKLLQTYRNKKTDIRDDIHRLTDGKETNPVLFAALSYIRKFNRFPLKIGQTIDTEQIMWDFIVDEYPRYNGFPDVIEYNERSFRREHIWKPYQETYAKKVLEYVLNI